MNNPEGSILKAKILLTWTKLSLFSRILIPSEHYPSERALSLKILAQFVLELLGNFSMVFFKAFEVYLFFHFHFPFHSRLHNNWTKHSLGNSAGESSDKLSPLREKMQVAFDGGSVEKGRRRGVRTWSRKSEITEKM